MSAVLNIYKKALELLSLQEQVVDINTLIHYLNNTNLNIKNIMQLVEDMRHYPN